MFKFLLLYWLVFVWHTHAALPQQKYEEEQFHEELVVTPLPNEHVNTYFQFTTRWHYGTKQNLHHTRLIPRSIAEFFLEYDVKELHIALTQSIWRYTEWGYPIVDAAMGAEAWAWFSRHNLTSDEVDTQWSQLSSVFSGILCASLNFIDTTNSIKPKYGFRPQFMPGGDGQQSQHVRYSVLPRENVCTENLTPWKKLLPCGSVYGFASLLNSGNVHNTRYHSLGIQVRTYCQRGKTENCILELTQTANLVYDLRILDGSSSDFSLRRLFGQGMHGDCVLATSSKIYVQRNNAGARYNLTPAPHNEITTTRGGYTNTFAVYDMKKNKRDERLFNIAWIQRKQSKTKMVNAQPPIYAHRYIAGLGQESGRIVTEITNSHYVELPIIIQEMIPWFVAIYLHTLDIRTAQKQLNASMLHYVPSKQRTSSAQLELGIVLPAQTTTRISIEFDYMLLKWLEYPPDANHGHYIGAAVITTQLPLARNYSAIPVEAMLFADSFNASRIGYFQTLRTESLLVSLPTPDFSMPYNVICLACTVVALAFGPIHSVATKRIVIDRGDLMSQKLLYRLYHTIKGLIIRKKPCAEEEETPDNDKNNAADELEKENEQVATKEVDKKK